MVRDATTTVILVMYGEKTQQTGVASENCLRGRHETGRLETGPGAIIFIFFNNNA